MADKESVVMDFLGSLRTGAAGVPRAELLTEDVSYMSSRGTVKGREAVMKNMAGPTAFTLFKKGEWSKARLDGDVVETVAEPEPGGVGSILRCSFAGGRIALIQDKAFGRPAVEQKGIKLSADVKQVINGAAEKKAPLILAYVDETGQPSLSFRGSTHVHGDDQLAIWLRSAEGGLQRAIKKNPKVALMYREPGGGMFHFHGHARLTTDPRERQTIYDNSPETERNHDFAMHGAAVIIDLDFVEGFLGRTPDGRSSGRERMRR